MRFTYIYLLAFVLFVIFQKAQAESPSDHDCATELTEQGRAIVYVHDGERSQWSETERHQLSFCFGPNMKRGRERMEGFIEEAAAQWMQYSDVTFINDGDCKGDSLFEVMWAPRQASFNARAFFPHYEAKRRKVKINRKMKNQSDPEVLRIMKHELGHVLGLRHEHIRPEAGGDCKEVEGTEFLTDYDPYSIMHYPRCGPKKLKNFVLSDLDKVGVGLLYPSPAER